MRLEHQREGLVCVKALKQMGIGNDLFTPGLWCDQLVVVLTKLRDPEEGADLVVRTSSVLDPLN